MNIKSLYFVRPVRTPEDPAASYLLLPDARYKSVTTEVKNNGVVLVFVRGDKSEGVYIPLSNIASMGIEPEAPPKK